LYAHKDGRFTGRHAGRGLLRDQTLKSPGLSYFAGKMCWVMADAANEVALLTGAANEVVFIIDDHVVNSRCGNLKEYLSE